MDDRHPDDVAAEAELASVAGLYFDAVIRSDYAGLDNDQVARIRKHYVKDVIKWSPITTWYIAKWYFEEYLKNVE